MFNCIRADTIARINNGYLKKKTGVQLRYSKETMNFLSVLKEEGYIKEFSMLEEDKKQCIVVILRYTKNRPALKSMKIVSRPGQRIYVKSDKIPVITNKFGCAILSTNHGVVTSQTAQELKIGGEIIAVVF